MKRLHFQTLLLTLSLTALTQAQPVDSSLSFFITSDSIGLGGNLGVSTAA